MLSVIQKRVFSIYPLYSLASPRGLIQNCMNADEDFKYLFEINADKLDRYYTGTRYPPLLDVTEEEVREAVDIAEKVREFILKKLRL